MQVLRPHDGRLLGDNGIQLQHDIGASEVLDAYLCECGQIVHGSPLQENVSVGRHAQVLLETMHAALVMGVAMFAESSTTHSEMVTASLQSKGDFEARPQSRDKVANCCLAPDAAVSVQDKASGLSSHEPFTGKLDVAMPVGIKATLRDALSSQQQASSINQQAACSKQQEANCNQPSSSKQHAAS